MKAIRPQVTIPGDNETDQFLYSRNDKGYSRESVLRAEIMARSGECVGMSPTFAIWRFGFLPQSEAAKAYGVYTYDHTFVWIKATRNGQVVSRWDGAAINMPSDFREIIDWEPEDDGSSD